MNLLSLDLEMNQPSGKIIQVGACVFKPRTGEILEQITIYVDPREPISKEITDLTGITDSDVQGKGTALEAYNRVTELHKKHRCFKNPVVWGSGVYNDSNHLYVESGSAEPNSMGFRVIDAKTLYQSIQILNNDTVKGGLEKAMRTIGLTFEGTPHRALDDAINTAHIYTVLAGYAIKGFKSDKALKAKI